jgi:hypothetical protein
MAIILNTNDVEQNYYQRIILENSFININGLYLFTHVYKTKSEREKEKLRQPLINQFLNNYNIRRNEISLIENDLEKQFQFIELDKIGRVIDVMNNFCYLGLNDKVEFTLKPEDIEEAKKYGYMEEWCLDPIILVRQDSIYVEEYKKQDFNLETFYQSLKDNIYVDKDGNILYVDDL